MMMIVVDDDFVNVVDDDIPQEVIDESKNANKKHDELYGLTTTTHTLS